MIRLEARHVVYAACNNGSSAVITKDGGLYMFGKDTAHCHQSSGELHLAHAGETYRDRASSLNEYLL